MTMRSIEFQRAGSYEDALARAAEDCGIEREYWDIFHKKHETSSDVQRRILQALGWDVSSFESVEEERLRRFRERATAVLPKLARGVRSRSVPRLPPWIRMAKTIASSALTVSVWGPFGEMA